MLVRLRPWGSPGSALVFLHPVGSGLQAFDDDDDDDALHPDPAEASWGMENRTGPG